MDELLKEIRDYWWFAGLLIIAAKAGGLWLLAIPVVLGLGGLIAAAHAMRRKAGSRHPSRTPAP